jgi:glycosyltransferase involved in cell wall biosynthesis
VREISAVIPAHDAAGSIASTTQSLAAEADVIKEILVSDNGSSDGTGAVAQEAGRQVGLPGDYPKNRRSDRSQPH